MHFDILYESTCLKVFHILYILFSRKSVEMLLSINSSIQYLLSISKTEALIATQTHTKLEFSKLF